MQLLLSSTLGVEGPCFFPTNSDFISFAFKFYYIHTDYKINFQLFYNFKIRVFNIFKKSLDGFTKIPTAHSSDMPLC